MKKKYYCRVCGSDKGHSFVNCTNVKGLRQIIQLQDDQIGKDLDAGKRHIDLQHQVDELKSVREWCLRIIEALLKLSEKSKAV